MRILLSSLLLLGGVNLILSRSIYFGNDYYNPNGWLANYDDELFGIPKNGYDDDFSRQFLDENSNELPEVLRSIQDFINDMDNIEENSDKRDEFEQNFEDSDVNAHDDDDDPILKIFFNTPFVHIDNVFAVSKSSEEKTDEGEEEEATSIQDLTKSSEENKDGNEFDISEKELEELAALLINLSAIDGLVDISNKFPHYSGEDDDDELKSREVDEVLQLFSSIIGKILEDDQSTKESKENIDGNDNDNDDCDDETASANDSNEENDDDDDDTAPENDSDEKNDEDEENDDETTPEIDSDEKNDDDYTTAVTDSDEENDDETTPDIDSDEKNDDDDTTAVTDSDEENDDETTPDIDSDEKNDDDDTTAVTDSDEDTDVTTPEPDSGEDNDGDNNNNDDTDDTSDSNENESFSLTFHSIDDAEHKENLNDHKYEIVDTSAKPLLTFNFDNNNVIEEYVDLRQDLDTEQETLKVNVQKLDKDFYNIISNNYNEENLNRFEKDYFVVHENLDRIKRNINAIQNLNSKLYLHKLVNQAVNKVRQ